MKKWMILLVLCGLLCGCTVKEEKQENEVVTNPNIGEQNEVEENPVLSFQELFDSLPFNSLVVQAKKLDFGVNQIIENELENVEMKKELIEEVEKGLQTGEDVIARYALEERVISKDEFIQLVPNGLYEEEYIEKVYRVDIDKDMVEELIKFEATDSAFENCYVDIYKLIDGAYGVRERGEYYSTSKENFLISYEGGYYLAHEEKKEDEIAIYLYSMNHSKTSQCVKITKKISKDLYEEKTLQKASHLGEEREDALRKITDGLIKADLSDGLYIEGQVKANASEVNYEIDSNQDGKKEKIHVVKNDEIFMFVDGVEKINLSLDSNGKVKEIYMEEKKEETLISILYQIEKDRYMVLHVCSKENAMEILKVSVIKRNYTIETEIVF